MTARMDRQITDGDPPAVQFSGGNVAELDVAWLVRQAASGDRHAWERLVDQYARLIWSIAKGFKLVESDASDVVQIIWMRLIEHIGRVQHPDRVGFWLAATARNECLRNLAMRKRLVLINQDDTFDRPAATSPRSTRHCSPRNRQARAPTSRHRDRRLCGKRGWPRAVGTVGSVSSCARRQHEHRHICDV